MCLLLISDGDRIIYYFGGVKDFDKEYVEIGSWGPSGSRVLSRFKHSISTNLLTELKKTQELVEFLVVNEKKQ